jgi:hypothetical protein
MKLDHPRDYRPIVLIAFAVALIVNGAVIGWAFWYGAQRPDVELTLLRVEDDTALCPGDTLDYEFVISVSKAASINLYTSEGNVSPHGVFSFTRLQQFDFDGKVDLKIVRNWTLESTYMDAIAGKEMPWLPGKYTQHTSAAVVGGRNSPSSINVPFSIKPKCP